MKLKQILLIVGISALSALTSVWIYGKVTTHQSGYAQSINSGHIPANYAGFFDGDNTTGGPVDFTKAANSAVPAVVHIKTKIPAKEINNKLPRSRNNSMQDLLDQFFNFGPQMPMVQPEQRASGSGVIISNDGYIITNNHVISDGGDGVADEITVTLHNKKEYKAKVIGRDPNSDIAVLKIDGNNFPFLLYGNSDNLQLGQWVLAVGYPLTLETTVTAGIVSAKGRDIGINGRQGSNPIESFIQTDAAVNKGNSGGPLITTDGELVGINSAIYAPTGTYAGYSFAIPVNLVKKIVNDLIEYGEVKRPYLGVSASQEHIDAADGAHIDEIAQDGAAAKIGLKSGDVITKIDGIPIHSWSELTANVSSHNAGDKISITYKRDGKEYETSAVLSTKQGTYKNLLAGIDKILGAELENIDEKTAKENNIEGGVLVKKITQGGVISKTRMDDGFIITTVNGMDISNISQMTEAIKNLKGETIQLEGIYPGYDGIYRYPLNMK